MSSNNLLRNPNFVKLCNKIKMQARSMEIKETLEVLKIVCFFGVASDSSIVQVLLQILRHNINDLSLQQIVFLSFLLKQFAATPLTEALSIALPIVFEIQLPIKMDRENITQMAEYLHYTTKSSVSDKCVETIVANAMRCSQEMDSKTAISIVWSICDLKPDFYFEALLNKAISVLNLNIDRLQYNDMETTLTKLVNKYSKKYSFYFNESFFDLCANYVIEKQTGAEVALYISRKLFKIVSKASSRKCRFNIHDFRHTLIII